MSSSGEFKSLESAVGTGDGTRKKRLDWVVFSPILAGPVIPLGRVLLSRWGASTQTVSRATIGMTVFFLAHGIYVMGRMDSLA